VRFDIKQMCKLLTTNALLLLLCGCGIGFAPWGDRQQMFESPDTMLLLKPRGRILAASVKNAPNIENVKEIWGEPDERLQLDDNTEIWKYRLNSFRWHGTFLYILFIPIPVVIPFGNEYSTLFIHKGQLVSGTYISSGATSEFYCGFLPLDTPRAKSWWPCGKIKP
jgi:hypothetical protein